MSRTEANAAAVRYWIEKAREALASARSEQQANKEVRSAVEKATELVRLLEGLAASRRADGT